jgi:hypothetical protein
MPYEFREWEEELQPQPSSALGGLVLAGLVVSIFFQLFSR